MTDAPLATPVALLVFNRPEATVRVFAAIRKERPSRLLVVADGPRPGRAGEAELCAEVRRIVSEVDWPCRVQHEFSEVNLGCRRRVATGIDWIFEQVEEAIILEDDCLPHPTFFRFCQELLDRYRDDPRVGMISGDNFQFGPTTTGDSYYFSRYFHIWGWATWRDRWQGSYDVALGKWPEVKEEPWFSGLLEDAGEIREWRKNFDLVQSGRLDTWDYQWVFANWLKRRLCVLPSVNLVSNVGFDACATHTKVAGALSNLRSQAMEFPLRHPREVLRNEDADARSRHRSSNLDKMKSLFGRLLARSYPGSDRR
ncbi:hemolytic protein HlpA [Citrifermentans bremense]|uniref:hemolytic protein HlpA n=1 Tax=Citrifermentans bremense TaxID=60035 RepID=UPI000421D45F|nr:hemolytic protein HlpA [Citrifermentans bremense]